MTRSIRLLVSVFVLLMVARPAYAYLDPGSGSMLLQLLLGGVAGIAVILQLFWRRILSLLRITSVKRRNDKGDAG